MACLQLVTHHLASVLLTCKRGVFHPDSWHVGDHWFWHLIHYFSPGSIWLLLGKA